MLYDFGSLQYHLGFRF